MKNPIVEENKIGSLLKNVNVGDEITIEGKDDYKFNRKVSYTDFDHPHIDAEIHIGNAATIQVIILVDKYDIHTVRWRYANEDRTGVVDKLWIWNEYDEITKFEV